LTEVVQKEVESPHGKELSTGQLQQGATGKWHPQDTSISTFATLAKQKK